MTPRLEAPRIDDRRAPVPAIRKQAWLAAALVLTLPVFPACLQAQTPPLGAVVGQATPSMMRPATGALAQTGIGGFVKQRRFVRASKHRTPPGLVLSRA
jgi:hypothetical protein